MRLNDLVKKYIFANKKNTILIIISIILSTTLFLVMNIISEDARNIVIDQAKKELGSQNGSYCEANYKDIENIKNHNSIDEVGTDMLLGIADVDKGQTLQIVYDDKVAMKINNSYRLEEGKMPTKENEIALDTWYIKQKKIKNPIGKTVVLDYSRYTRDGENILYKGKKEFKIVGILKSNSILKAQGVSIGAISKECAINNIPIKNKVDQVMFTFKKERNIEKQVNKLIEDCNLNKDNIWVNKVIVNAIADSMSLKIPYMITNMVLALATILLIYNIFYILVTSRTKDFGILRAIGFIPKDIGKIMTLEVLMYSIISIPIGLILGYIISNLCRSYVIGVIYNVNYVNIIKSDSYLSAYIFTILLSSITIIISVIKPIIMSYKVDPMTCIKRSDEKIVINQNSIVSKFMKKFFGDYGNIASKNIQRNKKRTRIMLASMTIVFFLLATVYTKATSNFLTDGGLRWWIPGDYLLHNIDMNSANDNKKAYDKKVLNDIKNIEGIKEVNATRLKNLDIDIDINKIDKNSSYWKESKDNIEMNAEAIKYTEGKKAYRAGFEVMGIEDGSMLDEFIIDGRENLDKINNKPYIYIDKYSSDTLKLKKGDKIKVHLNIKDDKTGNYKGSISKDFTIAGIIEIIPLTSQAASTSFGGVMSVNQMNKFTGIDTYERFDIWTSKLADDEYVESELNKILDNNIPKYGKGVLIPYKMESQDIEKSDNQKLLIMVMVISVIVILSVFNILNTIVTNINSRNREFALFRGIGIGKNEINKIVKLEVLIYIVVSFIVSLVPTLIVRSIIIKDFENISLINIKFIIAMFVILLSLTFITILTTLRVVKKSQSDNFIEMIKTLD